MKEYNYEEYNNDPMMVDYERLASVFEEVWEGKLDFFPALRKLYKIIGEDLRESADMDTVWDLLYQYIFWESDAIHDAVWLLLDTSNQENLYDRFIEVLFLKAFIMK